MVNSAGYWLCPEMCCRHAYNPETVDRISKMLPEALLFLSEQIRLLIGFEKFPICFRMLMSIQIKILHERFDSLVCLEIIAVGYSCWLYKLLFFICSFCCYLIHYLGNSLCVVSRNRILAYCLYMGKLNVSVLQEYCGWEKGRIP